MGIHLLIKWVNILCFNDEIIKISIGPMGLGSRGLRMPKAHGDDTPFVLPPGCIPSDALQGV